MDENLELNEEMTSQDRSFMLILYAGNAKSCAMEAILNAKKGDYELSEKKLVEAGEELTKAHQMQTDLLVKMANGEKVDLDILMVHAQDHLNGAILINDLARIIISMQKEIEELKAQVSNK